MSPENIAAVTASIARAKARGIPLNSSAPAARLLERTTLQ